MTPAFLVGVQASPPFQLRTLCARFLLVFNPTRRQAPFVFINSTLLRFLVNEVSLLVGKISHHMAVVVFCYTRIVTLLDLIRYIVLLCEYFYY